MSSEHRCCAFIQYMKGNQKSMNKAFQFRILPDEEQEILLAKTFGCVRFIYNKMLEDKKNHYEATGKMLKHTPAQYKPEHEWLKEVDSLALANAQLHLEAAYDNFFRDKEVGFPKFKSKHSGKASYTTNLTNGNIYLSNGILRLPKLGLVKIKRHRQVPKSYRLKSVTVKKTASGKYLASILYEYDQDIPKVEPKNAIGLDYSMKELFVSSNNEYPNYPRFYRRAQEKLAIEQRKLSKCEKGSNNWKKQNAKVNRIHEKIANQRKGFLHKIARQIANAYDIVCVEDLDMRNMAQEPNYGKTVSDNGFGMFRLMLAYKLAEQGKYFVKIDKKYPSTKTCSRCNKKKKEMPLALRVYSCDKCGLVIDRDLNAAVNIRNEGCRKNGAAHLEQRTVGHTGIARECLGREREKEAPASSAIGAKRRE